ncbi:MAG: HlyD family efflux transporter periplasmic adaptor subunit [Planctomycetaceae bacterium]
MIQAAVPEQPMLPSALRPIPMRARPDLVVERIDYQGQRSFVVKDPVGLKYHRLRPEQYRTLRLLDNRRGLEELRDALRIEFPALHLRLTDVQSLVSDLHKGGLLYTDRPGQGAAMLGKKRVERRKKIKQTLKSFMYLRLPGWDPETTLAAMLPFVAWILRPWAVAVTWAFVASAWILLGVNFAEFSRDMPAFEQFFGWPNVFYMWITLALCKVVHEFGHGLSCKYFGSECHEMGVMLLVFSPCLYCDVTDSWMLRSKWKRIAIAAAGMYVEVVLSAFAIYIWAFAGDGMVKMLALNVFFVTTLTTVIFNANPLMRFDGYYMLSDFLEIPNLRQKADKLLREKFSWYCLGIEPRHDPFMPETGTFWFVTYAIAAWAYRWFIMFGIAIFLYTWLKPYGLQSIGATIAVASIVGAVVAPGYALYKILSAPRTDPLSKPKIAATLVLLAAALVALAMVPLPLHVTAPFLVEPAGGRPVYVTTPGEIMKIDVAPGDRVELGTVLAVLSNPEMEDELRQLEAERMTEAERGEAFAQARDEARQQQAEQRVIGLDKRIVETKQRLAELTITAPIAGIVIAPTEQQPSQESTTGTTLPTWSGTPLDAENRGAFLEEGTVLLTLAPLDRAGQVEATLLVDQSDRNDVYPGQNVELRFDHIPDTLYESKVAEFSPRPVEHAPPPLSNKYGGPLATVSDQDGRERLSSNAYQALVLLDADRDLMRSGLRGTARLDAARSAAEWAWRWFRQTFHFRL